MNNDMMGDDAPPIDASIDAPPIPDGYSKLIGRTWSIPVGQEIYRCARFTVTSDTYVTNIMAQAPSGTHHTVLSISDGSTQGADGDYDCSVGELGMVMLYASGVGTSPLDFPSGVGVKIAAGTQIHLNLHLFNATDKVITGDSGILVKSQSTPTTTLAEMVFAGKFLFSVPKMTANFAVNGGCTSNKTFTLFALWPHMHKIGVKQTFEVVHNSTTTKLHDGPFQFAEQNYYLQTPEFQVTSGDQIKVQCVYTNNSTSNVTFGESSNQEMCFTGMYRYPAAGAGLFECTDQPGF